MDDSTSQVSSTTSANAIALPTCAALAILITSVPLRMLYRVKNIGSCSLIIVLGIINLFTFLNAILWPNDNWFMWWSGAGLCDIEVEFRTPLFTALATSTACITRQLARAVDVDNARLNETRASRRRRIIFDILFCSAIPVLQLALHYVVQSSRYAIVTIYGCGDVLDISWPRVLIMHIWPLLFALANCYYAVTVIYRLRKYRNRFSNTLSSTGSGLTPKKFFKLFLLSASLLVIYLPVTIYYFYLNLPHPWLPYSWSRVHNAKSWTPIVFYRTADMPHLQYDGWLGIAMAILVFCFFGINNDAVDVYRNWLVKCGFGKVWPSLLQPREPRGSRNSRTSWTTQFDLVSKVMHYFDTTRKDSQATVSGGPRSDGTQSRRGSSATFEHIALARLPTSTASSTELQGHNTTPIPDASIPDLITPAPAPLPWITRPPQYPYKALTVNQNRTFLSTFRTQIKLPFPLLSSSYSNRTSTENANNVMRHTPDSSTIDLEAQTQILWPAVPSSFRSLSIVDSNTVSTTIWSSQSSDFDSLIPKMGTRAYREREKQEIEQGKEEMKTRTGLSDNIDIVTLMQGRAEVDGSGVRVEERKASVLVTTKLERCEEVAATVPKSNTIESLQPAEELTKE